MAPKAVQHMSSVLFNLEISEGYERLSQAMDNLDGQAGPLIDEVLQSKGGQTIEENIHMLLPVSGRHWKKKKAPAVSAQPFTQEFEDMSVTTRTVKNYHYLYFPDDGTNTYHHIGYHGVPREFMYHGAENSAEKIIDMCVDRIIQELEV